MSNTFDNPADGILKGYWIAVFGGASQYTEQQIVAAHEAGKALAAHGANLLTESTTSIPYPTALGARNTGALVVGISPAGCQEEHLYRDHMPVDGMPLRKCSGMGWISTDRATSE